MTFSTTTFRYGSPPGDHFAHPHIAWGCDLSRHNGAGPHLSTIHKSYYRY